jgi:hypothetical protein
MANKTNKTKHKPQPSAIPPRKGLPKPVAPGAELSSERICWRFSYADHEGPWCFHEIAAADLCEVLAKLGTFESMKITELFTGDPGKDYDVEQIPNKLALERLTAMNLADQTRISRLQLGGKPRLYGFRHDNVFEIIWWDAEHVIWPSKLKHT